MNNVIYLQEYKYRRRWCDLDKAVIIDLWKSFSNLADSTYPFSANATKDMLDQIKRHMNNGTWHTDEEK
jgi:hypothetical protein